MLMDKPGPKTKTDRDQSTHQPTSDVLGRQTTDAVAITNPNVDNRVLALATAYDTGGRPYLFTSYNSATGTDAVANQVNQVQRTFNGLYQLTSETQTHGNSQVTPYTVSYAYSFVGTSGGPNHSRLTNMTYPSSRIVRYEYNSGLDASISRLSFLADDNAGQVGTHLEEYSYVGLNTVVKRAHPEPGVDLSYINAPGGSSDGGDQYTGLDRFGRILDQYWAQSGSATDSFQYAYDRDGNRLTRNNLLRTILHDFDEAYTYDNFNQLTYFTRNTHSQDWRQGLDNLGNWKTFSNDQTGPPSETRTHNAQNQITSLTGTGVSTPSYDANGNTTKDEWNNTYTFDAWNRLAQAFPFAGGQPQSYSYDALNRRMTENSGSARELYYSKDWQVLEERIGGSMQYQIVWSPLHVDALVLRDSNPGQRLYVQQDANWNVTAIIGKPVTVWVVQERYAYDPYGKPTVLDPNTWTVSGSGAYGTSSFAWVYLHQGGRYTRFDDLSGLYYFRNRDLSPTLGRWMEEDPIGYSARDNNLYRYLRNAPMTNLDPRGEDAMGGYFPRYYNFVIGDDYKGIVRTMGCSECQAKQLAAQTSKACSCIHKALYLIETFWDQVVQYYPNPSAYFGVLFDEGNRDFYMGVLRDTYNACTKGSVTYRCQPIGRQGTPAGTPFWPKPTWGGIQWVPGSDIEIYPAFWGTIRIPQDEIISHECGRRFGGIYEDTGVNKDNIYVFDRIVQVLCRDYDAIVK